ncbi:MAG TPA: TonB-dependent receptor, partial [Woeseiaceae bacterium]|nr:TonB-dependent receptor [Woeseiaceae bacterium]
GGPYTIRVESARYQDALVTDVYTDLSAPASFSIALGGADEEIEEIVVLASQVQTVQMAVGPGSSFTLDDIESMPSIARQVRDVIRSDPRVSLGRADNGAGYGINCLGANSRSNAFTIDGAVANDGFGLNEGTGTSARFAFPVPYDSISSVSVEFAPLDVQYGQFKGCAINVVTKPGSNEFFGSAFYLYNDEGLTGDKLQGDPVSSDPFEDLNYGFDLGGPIIKDKLFFFLSYEETDEGGIQNTGPIGGGFANEDFLTVAEAEQIAAILNSQYERNVGDIVRTLPQTSERTFLRLDWNINDQHRAEFTYTKLEELNLDPDDLGFDGFTFRDNFEFEGIDQDIVSARLFSSWADNFSTEFRYSSFDVTDIQGPAGGGEAQDANPIPRIRVENGEGDALLLSGPGRFRSANALNYTIDQLKLSADYVVGDHTLTFGFEQESRDVFNLFIENATGTIVFDDIAALQAGTASQIDMFGSYTEDPSDAAALFKRDINTFYLQDEWQVSDSLMVIAGVRYDSYDSSDKPILNPVFEERYGFDNTQTFDGLELVQPRIGLTWDMPTSKWGQTQLTAGFGVFGGQDPTVHFANSYQNFGGAIGFARVRDNGSDTAPCTDADLQVIDEGNNFTGIPACLRQGAAAAARANTGPVAAVDPNFELPEDHRFHIGLKHFMESDIEFLDDWQIRLEYIHTKHKNATNWLDLRITESDITLPDGRPKMMEVDPLLEGCDATFNGIGRGFSGSEVVLGGACDDSGNPNQDILMTNGVEGETDVFSVILGKDFQF